MKIPDTIKGCSQRIWWERMEIDGEHWFYRDPVSGGLVASPKVGLAGGPVSLRKYLVKCAVNDGMEAPDGWRVKGRRGGATCGDPYCLRPSHQSYSKVVTRIGPAAVPYPEDWLARGSGWSWDSSDRTAIAARCLAALAYFTTLGEDEDPIAKVRKIYENSFKMPGSWWREWFAVFIQTRLLSVEYLDELIKVYGLPKMNDNDRSKLRKGKRALHDK